MPIIDILLIAVIAVSAFIGWREGAITVLASLLGFVGGALIGAVSGRAITDWLGTLIGTDSAVTRTIIGTAVITIIALGAQLTAAFAASKIPHRWRVGAVAVADKAAGGVAAAAVGATAIWLVAAISLNIAAPQFVGILRSSAVVAALDTVAPSPAPLLRSLDSIGFGTGLPNGLSGPAITAAPNKAVPAAVHARSLSVVKVEADQPACNLGSEGSGWVFAKDRVLTNAHVVAASGAVAIAASDGSQKYPATVTYFDPAHDLAVLYSPGLPLPVAPEGADLAAGDPAVAVGFPENGPYTETPARVRAVQTAGEPDIYGRGKTAQQVYSLRAGIRHGNSGGPLFDNTGRVVGLVFGKSTTDDDTGYAFTLDQLRDALTATAVDPVPTGECLHSVSAGPAGR